MDYYVSKNGSDQNSGTKEYPFLTIQKAANVAAPSDTVTVQEGVYREWVKPRQKGLDSKRRITYQAAEGEKVVIKGSEPISNWVRTSGNVWKAIVPNHLFENDNPFAKEIFGDWLVTRNVTKHLGDVYLNGMSFYEATTLAELENPQVRTEIVDHWTEKVTSIQNPNQTKYLWFAEVDGDNTIIYANFQEADPTKELVEINVRQSCFYPEEIGIDYITVKGFEMAHGASGWAPPTGDQPGLVGPKWSKGWIIENNIIHDAKCSAITVGKEASTGDNYCSRRKDKSGYQYQLEAVFSAKRFGWSKKTIGSHIIRNNEIYDCGQNAIVGHLGGVFSEIHHNHIYNIAIKREYYGHEIAGIKMHAAIDCHIHHNRIHDCSLGLWSDWETQGTRISKNIFYNNNRDLFVEVSHGPYVVDNNIFTADYALDNMSQGGAYVNNIFCGGIKQNNVMDRSTQYHLPHSTEVAGFAFVYGGDDRYFNNIFIKEKGVEDAGTAQYNGHPTSLEEYIEIADSVIGDEEHYRNVKQPVYINSNVYLQGASSFDREENALKTTENANFKLYTKDNKGYMNITLPEAFDTFLGEVHSTITLPRVRIVDAQFDLTTGDDLVLDTDLLNQKREHSSTAGPLMQLKSGLNELRLW